MRIDINKRNHSKDKEIEAFHMTNSEAKTRSKKRGELLWPRVLVKKWLNIKSGGDEFSADEHEDTESDGTESENEEEYTRSAVASSYIRSSHKRGSFSSLLSQNNERTMKWRPDRKRRGQSETFRTQYIDTQELRIAVGTWNVAGRNPTPDLELDDWLEMRDPADIYVLGFQEIVPLNAGNVLGAEDNGPAVKWQALIRETLNKESTSNYKCHSAPPSPWREETSEPSDMLLRDAEVDAESMVIDEKTSFVPLESYQLPTSDKGSEQMTATDKPDLQSVYSSTERIGLDASVQRTESEPINWLSTVSFSDDSGSTEDALVRPLLSPFSRGRSTLINPAAKKRTRYVRVASKQMVGIHISVWVRRKLRRYIRNLTVSCVGIGLMGYLGNKGSISVSMVLHQTSFCFVCTHLTSGDKEGDELRRNGDVMEILRRTYFPPTKAAGINVPETILGHDRIIWLGDLNYRLNLPDRVTRSLVAKQEWAALLEKDQLRKEFTKGRIFEGWQEAPIDFAPTYKYEFNSDRYNGENAKAGEKRRTPAWCDRILWHGKGLRKLSYTRVESNLSDHRPVNALLLAEVEVFSARKLNKALSFKNGKPEIAELLSDPQTDMAFRNLHFDKDP